MKHRSKQQGWSLFELIVTMAIIGLLAAIAIPAYGNYTKRANRTDATRSMSIAAQALERCYSQAFTYVGCTSAPAGSTPSAQGYYTVVIAITSASYYTITATPFKSPQTSDSACGTMTLNSSGTQGATTSGGVANTAQCWGST